LARFDGREWRVYDQDNTPLSLPHVAAVAVGLDEVVWVGSGNVTTGGLYAFDGSDWEVFTPVDSPLPCSIVETLEVDTAGVLWVGTSQCQGAGGLARLKEGVWAVFDIDRSPMPYNAVETLSFDSKGGVWLGSQASFFANPDILHGALLYYDGLQWEQSPPADSGKTSNRVTALAVDDRDRLWVATSPDGSFNYELAVRDEGGWQVLSALEDGFPHAFIQDLTVDAAGRLWAASDQGVIIVESD
jgi:ligand-binding sensor domain-containing protein